MNGHTAKINGHVRVKYARDGSIVAGTLPHNSALARQCAAIVYLRFVKTTCVALGETTCSEH
jgi:hypothetical protein